MNIEKIIARDPKTAESYLKEENLTFWRKLNFKIRYWCYTHFGIFGFWDIFPYGWQRFYYDHIKTIFKPHHTRLRKAIPRQWSDLTCLIVDVNFEIIKSFYEDEYKGGWVDWQSDEQHKKFSKWLEKAYKYITIEKPNLEKQKEEAYPKSNFDDMFGERQKDEHGNITRTMKSCEEVYGKSYSEIYGEVDRLEQLISKKDTEILTQLIKNRDFFWT